MEMNYASNAKGNLGVTLGAIGTGLAALNGGNGGILSGLFGNGNGGCSEDHCVNRYEAAQQARIAELETEVKLRDSTIYTDQKSLQLYQYIDGQLKDVRAELCNQRVHNQRTEDSFALAAADLAATKKELYCAINNEAEKRCCGDNAIVNYVNATFYPKMTADVTTGTTTTAQTIYNPLPNCGCGCK
jgi:hypothetical protein